jgi:hypothetical protein
MQRTFSPEEVVTLPTSPHKYKHSIVWPKMLSPVTQSLK